ncbi:MAG: BON domain-containing protein [Armatimonadota bacterium]|jgi:osmotically-inducible protein OsmY
MAVAAKLSALRIKANILADSVIGLMDVEAEVENHVAVLTGQVQTQGQKQRAEDLAYEIEEIDEVINKIEVVQSDGVPADAHLGYSMAEGDLSETPFAIGGESAGPASDMAASEQFAGEFSDEQIERAVCEKLARQNMVDASDIKVRSTNQIVYLEGTTTGDLNLLQDLVLNVRGVMGVDSSVTNADIPGKI